MSKRPLESKVTYEQVAALTDAPVESCVESVPHTCSIERRRSEDRRVSSYDRRAFWRPTPDRRREATSEGRRQNDLEKEPTEA